MCMKSIKQLANQKIGATNLMQKSNTKLQRKKNTLHVNNYTSKQILITIFNAAVDFSILFISWTYHTGTYEKNTTLNVPSAYKIIIQNSTEYTKKCWTKKVNVFEAICICVYCILLCSSHNKTLHSKSGL